MGAMGHNLNRQDAKNAKVLADRHRGTGQRANIQLSTFNAEHRIAEQCSALLNKLQTLNLNPKRKGISL